MRFSPLKIAYLRANMNNTATYVLSVSFRTKPIHMFEFTLEFEYFTCNHLYNREEFSMEESKRGLICSNVKIEFFLKKLFEENLIDTDTYTIAMSKRKEGKRSVVME